MKRIDRIKAMEQKYEKALLAVRELDTALAAYRDALTDIDDLIAYYGSDTWQKDYAAAAEGRLPSDLKHAVLSQDGLYDLLSDHQRLKELLTAYESE